MNQAKRNSYKGIIFQWGALKKAPSFVPGSMDKPTYLG